MKTLNVVVCSLCAGIIKCGPLTFNGTVVRTLYLKIDTLRVSSSGI